MNPFVFVPYHVWVKSIRLAGENKGGIFKFGWKTQAMVYLFLFLGFSVITCILGRSTWVSRLELFSFVLLFLAEIFLRRSDKQYIYIEA